MTKLKNINQMRLTFAIIFSGVFCAFFLLDNHFDDLLETPRKYTPVWHELLSKVEPIQQIFSHTETDQWIRLGEDINLEEKKVAGIRIFIGTYGEKLLTQKLELKIVGRTGVIFCNHQGSISIKDNNWSDFLFDGCESKTIENNTDEAGVFFNLATAKPQKFAIYAASDLAAAYSFIVYSSQFHKIEKYSGVSRLARNYGSFWHAGVFLKMLWTWRFLVALAAAFFGTLFFYPQLALFSGSHWSSFIFVGFVLWICIVVGHALFHPPYQNPDEPGLLMGVIQENSKRVGEMIEEVHQGAGPSQFACVRFHSETPIIMNRECVRRLPKDVIVAPPRSRGLAYADILRVLYPLAENSWQKYSEVFSSYIGHYLKLLTTLVNIICAAVWLFILLKVERPTSGIVFLVSLLLPAFIPQLAEISNYGLAYICGAVFASSLIPEGGVRVRQILISISAIPGFLIICLTTSQVAFFVVLPVLICISLFLNFKDEPERGRQAMKYTLIIFFLTLAFYRIWLGPEWLLREFRLDDKIGSILPEFAMSVLNAMRLQLNVGIAKVSFAASVTLSFAILYVALVGHGKSKLEKMIHKMGFTAVGSIVLLMTASMIFGIIDFYEPTYVKSLTSTERPAFLTFFINSFRALASQTFHWGQDFFLIRTYVMAYGWLDAQASDWVYFLARWLLIGFFCYFTTWYFKTRSVLASILAVFIGLWCAYWLSSFYAAWLEGHTLVARYVSPMLPILILCLLLPWVSTRQSVNFYSPAEAARSIKFLILFLVVLNFYGAEWVVPLRFLIGT